MRRRTPPCRCVTAEAPLVVVRNACELRWSTHHDDSGWGVNPTRSVTCPPLVPGHGHRRSPVCVCVCVCECVSVCVCVCVCVCVGKTLTCAPFVYVCVHARCVHRCRRASYGSMCHTKYPRSCTHGRDHTGSLLGHVSNPNISRCTGPIVMTIRAQWFYRPSSSCYCSHCSCQCARMLTISFMPRMSTNETQALMAAYRPPDRLHIAHGIRFLISTH